MTAPAVVKSGTDLVRHSTGEVVGEVEAFSMQEYLISVNAPAALEHQKKLAAAYDAACASLIGPNDVQVEGSRTFKKKSAWRKLQRHFNISTEIRHVEKEMLGDLFCATVTVRATAPWGQSSEAVGACSTDEESGRRKITIADAIATAETRATNRSVSNLIAMGEVSAEEMTKGPAEVKATIVGDSQTSSPVTEVTCPKCGGAMYDNRLTKTKATQPDFKCKNYKNCEGVIWPPKELVALGGGPAGKNDRRAMERNQKVDADYEEFPDALREREDDLPF